MNPASRHAPAQAPRRSAHRRHRLLGLALACAVAAPATAAPSLRSDCAADQADRRGDPAAATHWAGVATRDAQRQQRVRATLKQGRLRSAEDYRCAALILVHAGDEASLRLSFSLAVQGQLLFPEQATLRRLAADAWDRLMMARQQPQWFATQFVTTPEASDRFQPYPMAAGLMSETERVRLGGLSDADVARQLAALNARPATPGAAAAPPPPAAVAISAGPTWLLAALDADLGLANVLAQLQQHGLQAAPQAAAGGDADVSARLIFLPRDAAALRRYALGEVPVLPRPEGSATPTTASVAEIRLARSADGQHSLWMGIDDGVQAAATLVVRPSRVFRVDVSPTTEGGGWVVTGFQRQP